MTLMDIGPVAFGGIREDHIILRSQHVLLFMAI